MATKKQRIIAFSVAIFFLITSAATTVAVIYTMMTSNDQPNASQAQSEAKANPLVGTKLADFTPLSVAVSELQKTDTKLGNGAEAKANSTIEVQYQGALASTGVIFDASSDDTPVTLSLQKVIEGWQKGIPGMKVGGSRRLVIPAAMAYKDQSPSPLIPANSDLVFDVTLVAVK